MTEVLVLVERADGSIRKATLELLTLARRLGEPAALVCGPLDDATTAVLGEYGATDGVRRRGRRARRLPRGAQGRRARRRGAASRRRPPCSSPPDPEGKEVAARAAVRLDSGIITDAVDVEAGDGGPVVTQSVFAGAWSATEPGGPWHADHRRPAERGRRAAGADADRSVTPCGHLHRRRSGGAASPAGPPRRAPGDPTSPTRKRRRRRRPGHGVGRGLPPRRAAGRRPRRRRRGLARRHRPGLVRPRLPDRPDRQDRRTRSSTSRAASRVRSSTGPACRARARSSPSTRTPKAPIFAIADFGVVGDLHTVLPALVAEIENAARP